MSTTAPASPGRSQGAVSHVEALSQTLRTAALRTAEQLGGRCLIFASTPGQQAGPPPLRAAAGFASTEAARITARQVESSLRSAVETARAQELDPAVAGLPGGEARIVPIAVAGRTLGAMLAAAPAPASAETWRLVESLLETAAIHLDHAVLVERTAQLEEALRGKQRDEDEKSDEILKLSEALFAQDIELLQNNEKLGKVEKLKNDFIEKMSRELRTPLNSIIEAIISVLAGENEHLSASAKENLRAALDDGTSFLRTLQNILDLWRIKQGELPVDVQEVNFREVIEEAIFSVQDTLGTKPVRIERHIEEPLPKVRTDLAKVNHVLFLLLDNAAKFTDEGRIRIEAGVRGGLLRCRITDTGIGICPDDREFIFDEFFQVDESQSSRYRGAGLGLTLVRDLLTLLDGELQLSSEVGAGTRVTFTVPVQPAS